MSLEVVIALISYGCVPVTDIEPKLCLHSESEVLKGD